MTSASLPRQRIGGQSLAGVAIVAAYVLVFAWSADHVSYNVTGALLIAPVLALISAPMIAAAQRREVDQRIAAMLPWALVAKLGASMVMYHIDSSLYGGSADGLGYAGKGATVAHALHHGQALHLGRLIGTPFMNFATGLLFYVTGPTAIGGYLIFGWLSFWGLYLFYRALVIGVPDANLWRYSRLLFFLPSLILWPSAIGKDAWMCFAFGLIAYGAARISKFMRGGMLAVAGGELMTILIRPHLAPVSLVALVVSLLVRPRLGHSRLSAASRKIGALGVAALAMLVVVSQATSYLNIHSLSAQSIGDAVSESQTRTANQGGSSFTAHPVHNPLDYVRAILTSLFRPFPFEAHNIQTLGASLEGVFLLVVFIACWRNIAAIRRHFRSSPYVAYSMVNAGLLIYGFSGFSNFGLLARERVQLIPSVLVALVVPIVHARQPAIPERQGVR